VEAAKAELEAAMAVDDALDPEIQAAWHELSKMFDSLREERDQGESAK